jgi:heme-based aerotactic transducer
MATREQITAEDRRGLDGQGLASDIGLTSEEIQWRKEFTGFDSADERRLQDMEATMEGRMDPMVEEFYERLTDHQRTTEIFGRSTKGIDQLKKTQRGYLEDLFEGSYDKEYFETRARIGKIHDMLDLGPEVYLGAYSTYYGHTIEAIADEAVDSTDSKREAVDHVVEHAMSLLKLLNLDQQVAMDTYIDAYNQEVQETVAEQEQLMSSVEEELEEPTEELRQSAESVADSIEEVSNYVGEQTDAMDEVSSEVADMSATVEEIASTASGVARTSEHTEDLATDGRESAEEAIDGMTAIDDAVDDAVDDVNDLRRRMSDIGEIVDIIDGVAEQTNLLALNASIEAAHAGEAGDGFAVVASEIKELAGESKSNAERIEKTVLQIQADTEDTVDSLETVTERVRTGIEQVEQTKSNLDDIVEAVREAVEGITEVSNATDDQASSTEEVATMVDRTVDELEQMSEELDRVAAANQEQTARIASIAETAEQLTD